MAESRPTTPRYDSFTPTSDHASKALSRVRKKDTKCEVALRRELWHRGFRYRKHYEPAPGAPDIAFPGEKLAIFCDGDFWHGRNWEERRKKLERGSNAGYWIPKIESNRARDRETKEILEERGWTVLRFWETDILSDPPGVADEIVEQLAKARQDEFTALPRLS